MQQTEEMQVQFLGWKDLLEKETRKRSREREREDRKDR